ncbi:MAG: nuclear transport factor 2 family protein [Alphaproteobacteria bacterium]|nr:nuclear transport factor 2 family protein [Alphaproteobacteria bacterium]MBF0394251.1 nuclear transport factor 2 family protein [Alphaproteobacteria bacterium]
MSNSEIVSRAYDHFNRKDFDGLAAMVAPDCSWNVAGPADIPWAGHYEGPEQVKAYARTLTETVDFQSFAPENFVEGGDTVVVCGSEKAVVKETGKEFVNLFAHVFTVKDGKITFFQEYGDTAEIEQALH